MSEQPLSRIPFRVDDEIMIASMAGWMRFIGVFTVISGVITLFMVALLAGMFSLVQHFDHPQLEQFHAQMMEGGLVLAGMGVVMLVVAALTIWAGWALYQAGVEFHLVARTDEADQDYLARGLNQLRLYFKLEVVKAVLGIVIVVLAIILWSAVRTTI